MREVKSNREKSTKAKVVSLKRLIKLTRFAKKKGEKTPVTKIRNERETLLLILHK